MQRLNKTKKEKIKKRKKKKPDAKRRNPKNPQEQVDKSRICIYKKPDGSPCKAIALKGKDYCTFHSPANMKQKSPVLKKGEYLGSPLKSVDDVMKDGKPFELRWFEKHYMKRIYESVSPYFAAIKSAQVGISEYELMKIIWFIRKYGMTARRRVMLTLPTATDAKDFSKDRIDSILWENRKLFGHEKEKRKKWTDNVSMKEVANSLIFIRGTKGKARHTSTPSDMNIHDEVNFSDAVTMSKFASRLGASEFQWVNWISTPTFPGEGIDEKFQDGCQFHFHVPCTDCDNWVKLCCEPLEHMDHENDIWACEKCGGELDRAAGRWIAERPELIGEKESFHITNPMRLNETPSSIMAKKDDYKREADWYNFVLGLTFESTGNRIAPLALEACTNAAYKLHLRDDRPCTMGVDQSSKWHHIHISSWDAKARRQTVWVEKVDTEESFDSTLDLLMRQFNIVIAVIDGSPNLNSAKKFAKKHKGRVFVHFHNDKMFDDVQWDEKEHKVVTNKTQMMDKLSEEVKRLEWICPDHPRTRELKKHIKNMRRRAGDEEEEKDARWVNVGEDHFNDAWMFDFIAKIRAKEFYEPQVRISTIGPDVDQKESEDIVMELIKVDDVEQIFSYFIQKNRGMFVADMVLSPSAKEVFINLEKSFGVKKILEVSKPSPHNAKFLSELMESQNHAEEEDANRDSDGEEEIPDYDPNPHEVFEDEKHNESFKKSSSKKAAKKKAKKKSKRGNTPGVARDTTTGVAITAITNDK